MCTSEILILKLFIMCNNYILYYLIIFWVGKNNNTFYFLYNNKFYKFFTNILLLTITGKYYIASGNCYRIIKNINFFRWILKVYVHAKLTHVWGHTVIIFNIFSYNYHNNWKYLNL